MSGFLKRLGRDEDGGPLIEATIMIPILITFLLGGVDFLNAFQQWSAAAKAVEIGARIAAVSDPVASGFDNLALNAANNTTTTVGAAMPAFTVTCDGGGTATCSCTGFCTGVGSYSAAAMGLIVYGRDGNGKCGDATSEYFLGMCDIFDADPAEICDGRLHVDGPRLRRPPRLGRSRRSRFRSTPAPRSCRSQFFFLPFATINIPPVTTTITGEACGCGGQLAMVRRRGEHARMSERSSSLAGDGGAKRRMRGSRSEARWHGAVAPSPHPRPLSRKGRGEASRRRGARAVARRKRRIMLPYVTVMLPVLVGFSLLALDASRFMSLQTQMQAAADNLALAGAANSTGSRAPRPAPYRRWRTPTRRASRPTRLWG